ncbi:MAG: hypothetical protein J6K32_08375 [Clostridia bacterium]|nr:hypothetical protein [Clostridia bacterium]
MESPFDTKNKFAARVDRIALRAALFLLCAGYFYVLFRRAALSLAAGAALFSLLLLSLALFERSTLSHRDRLLRERIGGAIVLDELLLLPGAQASQAVCLLLSGALGGQAIGDAHMLCEGETWLVRCAQCMQGSSASEGDVLAAHRARVESGADRCALASLGGFSPEAVRAAEWMDPPVRLISGRQLARLAGSRHPATDEEIARHARQKRVPFSWRRILALALSPAKTKRHLACAALLALLYLLLGSFITLLCALLSLTLAILSHQEGRKRFRL